MDRRTVRTGQLRGQPRGPHGGMDEQSMGFDHAPGPRPTFSRNRSGTEFRSPSSTNRTTTLSSNLSRGTPHREMAEKSLPPEPGFKMAAAYGPARVTRRLHRHSPRTVDSPIGKSRNDQLSIRSTGATFYGTGERVSSLSAPPRLRAASLPPAVAARNPLRPARRRRRPGRPAPHRRAPPAPHRRAPTTGNSCCRSIGLPAAAGKAPTWPRKRGCIRSWASRRGSIFFMAARPSPSSPLLRPARPSWASATPRRLPVPSNREHRWSGDRSLPPAQPILYRIATSETDPYATGHGWQEDRNSGS